jgi:hypothetical protein
VAKKKTWWKRASQSWKLYKTTIFNWGSILAQVISTLAIYYDLRQIRAGSKEVGNIILWMLVLLSALIWLFVNTTRHADRARQDYNAEKNKVLDLQEENRDLSRSHEVVAKAIHNICHRYRDVLTHFHFAQITGDRVPLKGDILPRFYVEAITNVKEVFDIITNDSCSVCFKIIDRDNFISTVLRDPVSGRSREAADNSPDLARFDYRRNTAFLKILNKEDTATYFACDDLIDLAASGGYINGNPNWQKLYNATLVAPLRYFYDKQNRESSVLGFICVDNFAGGLENEAAKDLLAWFADLCFHLWCLTGASSERLSGLETYMKGGHTEGI